MNHETVTIYKGRDKRAGALRVVRGDHVPHANSAADQITVYPSIALAKARETAARVVSALDLIDPAPVALAPVVDTADAARNAIELFDTFYSAAHGSFDHAGLLDEMQARNGGAPLASKDQRVLARMVDAYLSRKVQS